jgi:hypothetical protein
VAFDEFSQCVSGVDWLGCDISWVLPVSASTPFKRSLGGAKVGVGLPHVGKELSGEHPRRSNEPDLWCLGRIG